MESLKPRRSSRLHGVLGSIAAALLGAAACARGSVPLTERPAARSEGARQPRFDLEVVLRGGGSGVLMFHQRLETPLVVYLDVAVRGLAPNTSHVLQRAVDTELDGTCTGTAWLTLGAGDTPQAIVTDERGAGRAALYRAVPPPAGASFDIHFRVVAESSGAVVLESGCYQYTLRG